MKIKYLIVAFLFFIQCNQIVDSNTSTLDTGDPKVAILYAKGNHHFMTTKDYTEAEKFYKEALSIDSTHYYSLTELGAVYMNTGKEKECMKFFDKAIMLRPDRDMAFRNRGMAYGMFYRDYEKAPNDFNKAIENNNEEASNYRYKATALQYLGNYDEAIKNFEKAIELKPDDYFLFSLKGESLLEAKRIKESVTAFTKSISLNPEYSRTYYFRAKSYYYLNKKELACSDYMKSLQLGGKESKYFIEICK